MEYQTLKYKSHAKINLFLHIINKREDGYHNLQTWVQFIDLYDIINFTIDKSADKLINIKSSIDLGDSKDNLIFKAANKLKAYAKNLSPLNVDLVKNIPIGAGLGGGSSNAATTLIALNKIWDCDISKKELLAIAATLGADVPVFVEQKTSWLEGIGEIITPKPYIEQFALVIKPNIHINTQSFFNKKELNKNYKPLKEKEVLSLEYLENAFTNVFFNQHSDIKDELKKLSFYNDLKLTGTGSCFYKLHKNIDVLKNNQKNIPNGIDSWVVKTVNSISVI